MISRRQSQFSEITPLQNNCSKTNGLMEGAFNFGTNGTFFVGNGRESEAHEENTLFKDDLDKQIDHPESDRIVTGI